MSEELPEEQLERPALGPSVPVGEGCPLGADFLAPNLRKHLDVRAPVPLRMMAAKALVPFTSSDLLAALFVLTFDPDPKVKETAKKTLAELPDRILAPALRDETVKPSVLKYCLTIYGARERDAEALVLNASTPDDSVAVLARTCSARIAELIAQNQLRVLRHDDIIRGLCQNPNLAKAIIDGVCDFAIRSGVILTDVPQMNEARQRVFGKDAVAPQPGPTAEDMVREFHELRDENAPQIEEGKRLTLGQRVMKMSIAEKIKLATLGNKEARGLLARDTNRLVAVAVVRSPRITDGEILSMAQNRAVVDEVLRVIYSNREWTKLYAVKLALVKNPKTPLTVAMKFLNTLRESEIKTIAKNKNVPSGVQMVAKKMIEKKTAPPKQH